MNKDAYEAAVLVDSPAVFYRLDETAGTVAEDISGNGRNGSYKGEPLLGAGHAGWPCCAFDGVNDFVETPALNSGAWSGAAIECWFVADVITLGTGLISERYTGSSDRITLEMGWGVGSSTTNWQAARYTGSAWTVVSPVAGPPMAGKLFHAFTQITTAGLITTYLNGSMVGSVNASWMTDTDSWYIGRRHDNANTPFFMGSIAYAAIYDHALDPRRIKAHYWSPDIWRSSLSPMRY